MFWNEILALMDPFLAISLLNKVSDILHLISIHWKHRHIYIYVQVTQKNGKFEMLIGSHVVFSTAEQGPWATANLAILVIMDQILKGK